MKLMLATLCLNEMEWLPKLYEQHRNWPDLVGWTFVESADRAYAQVHPELVTNDGLSVDGTSGYLSSLTDIRYVPFGFAEHPADRAQAKCMARSQYLRVADELQPDWIMVVDADEFVTRPHQQVMRDILNNLPPEYDCCCFATRNIWRPKHIESEPLFRFEVCGGVWGVANCRAWRWHRGSRYYQNHNWIETAEGKLLNDDMFRMDANRSPCHIHLGYAGCSDLRKAKTDYYTRRGDNKTSERQMHEANRREYERWTGGMLSHGAFITEYDGPIPECFQ